MKFRMSKRKQMQILAKTAVALLILTVIAVIVSIVVLVKGGKGYEEADEPFESKLSGQSMNATEGAGNTAWADELRESTAPPVPAGNASNEEDTPDGAGDEQTPSEQEAEGVTETTTDAARIDQVEKLLTEMSLHDKICQMMLVAPETLTGVQTATAAGAQTKEALTAYPVGGVILFAANLENAEQTTTMLSNLQSYAKDINGIGLFLSVDEEGGRVARVASKLGTTKLNPMYQYREQGAQTAYRNAATIANDISSFGFNLDFAPVADTWSNPANTVIGERAYSDDYEEAAELVASAVDGFHSADVMCTLKHFPGHGDTAEDSHSGSAYSQKTIDELRRGELLPFQAGIRAGADMVMVGHITLPELDTLPASLSSVIITDILRGEIGYDGVVITDSLSMKALTDLYGNERIAVMAVLAGNDLLLCQSGMKSMVSAIEKAVENGEISEERIDESVRRILQLKYRYGLLEIQ